MGKIIAALIAALVAFALARGQGPKDAVVRMPSHGCSATVIYSAPGMTYLLGCGHAYDAEHGQSMRSKRMTFDIPTTAQLGAGQTARPPQYLIARDPRWDLALVRVDAGPFPYVCPVVGAGYNPVGRRIVSVGYDEMRLPVTVRTATVTRLSGGQVFTREPPWHGRSGGSLIDVDLGCLVGVCSGYAGNPGMAARESPLGGPGIYVSHTAVRSFLSHYGWR